MKDKDYEDNVLNFSDLNYVSEDEDFEEEDFDQEEDFEEEGFDDDNFDDADEYGFFDDEDEEDIKLTIKDDMGNEIDCIILGVFDSEEKDYIVLIPEEVVGSGDVDDLLIFKYSETEDGLMILDPIESEEEFDILSAEFAEKVLSELEEFIDFTEEEDNIVYLDNTDDEDDDDDDDFV